MIIPPHVGSLSPGLSGATATATPGHTPGIEAPPPWPSLASIVSPCVASVAYLGAIGLLKRRTGPEVRSKPFELLHNGCARGRWLGKQVEAHQTF